VATSQKTATAANIGSGTCCRPALPIAMPRTLKPTTISSTMLAAPRMKPSTR
jgi:hypothetical protein